MKEIKLTQGKVTMVDDEDFEFLSKWSWYCHQGYARRRAILCDGEHRTIYIQWLLLFPFDGQEIDHINGNKLDNRKSNLRLCTRQENVRNRTIPINNKSGYKGVRWHKGKWVAQIGTDIGKNVHLGRFECKHEAARAYNKAVLKYHGEFGVINEGVVDEKS